MFGLRRLFGATERKDSAVGRLLYNLTMGNVVWTPRKYDKLAEEAYVQNVIAHRCVTLVSEAAASIPLSVFDSGSDEPMTTHPFLDLMSRPNRYQSGFELMSEYFSYLQLAGNAYMEEVSLPSSRGPAELFCLRPDRMKVRLSPRGYPAAFVYEAAGQTQTFDMPVLPTEQAPILHSRLFHPTNDTYGLSRTEAAAYSIDTHNEASRFGKQFLQNRCRPEGALTYTDPTKEGRTLTDVQFDRLKKEMEEQYSGPDNAGRPMLLDGGLQWVPYTYSPRDADLMESRRESAREIALAFGVPPMILGIPGDNTYSNYREANLALYRQTVLPLFRRVAMDLSAFLQPSYGDRFRIEADYDQIPALSLEREQVWDRVQGATDLTINERRRELGYEDVDGGDVVLVSSTQVPLEDLGFEPGGPAPADEEPQEEDDESQE
jgi:HK97 family phage portal protein